MKTELQDIYTSILEGCVREAEYNLYNKEFKYSNVLSDIVVKISGEIYGDGISFQRGKINNIDISSNIHNISDEDKKEFSENIINDFWKLINIIYV